MSRLRRLTTAFVHPPKTIHWFQVSTRMSPSGGKNGEVEFAVRNHQSAMSSSGSQTGVEHLPEPAPSAARAAGPYRRDDGRGHPGRHAEPTLFDARMFRCDSCQCMTRFSSRKNAPVRAIPRMPATMM